MVLKNEVEVELWEAINKNYEVGSYKGAILDAVFVLTDTIRNKTGLEGDGSSLIGQAFGGDNPKIKLNNLQSDSEKDVQRGIQEILRGIYTGIRNPRSHDSIQDDKETADAIIVFINHLLSLIDKSKLSFEVEDYLKRVFDPYYVKSDEYSKLLVEEIPKRQRCNIAIAVVLRKEQGNIYTLGYFLEALFQKLEPEEISRVCKVISDDLRTTTEHKKIRYILNIVPEEYWAGIDMAVRMRIENLLFEDFSKGSYDKEKEECEKYGALATWITEKHLSSFSFLDKWTRRALEALESENEKEKAYVQEYFIEKIYAANRDNITYPLKYYFREGLKSGNKEIIDIIEEEIMWDENHPWRTVFEKEIELYPRLKQVIECPF
ncbi:MAG: TIGR02391 family protein [Lachnospiraceae bacterium]|nr:TIGR02391 family protein [Lachnospiraceae bacterium]